MSNIPEEIKHALTNDYPLIPMNEITDEARLCAVAWMECEDRKWIMQKQKLASDIMNYARRQAAAKDKQIENMIEVFQWLLGYTDFPGKVEGQPPFYWRTLMREKLKAFGIEIPAPEGFTNQ